MKTQFTMGAFGIILDERDRVLLVHRNDYDFWNLPGGGVNSGEAPWDACVREVKEETGFDVEVVGLAGLSFKTIKDDLVSIFLCKIIGGERTLNAEARAIEFFQITDFPTNTNRLGRELSEHALKKNKEIFLRSNDSPSTIELLRQGKNPW